jgi:hypothetical protein
VGGAGSGNTWNHSSRAKCEGQRRIDLRYLTRRRLLAPGYSGTLRWSIGDEPNGSIGFSVTPGGLQLLYAVTDDEGERRTIDERVAFGYSDQHLGGRRRWLLCPRCRRRCGVLYGGSRFRCRRCWRLAYQSQSEAPMWRALSQAQKHRQRLGGSGSMDEPFPDKPEGMHWRTYAKHLAKADRLERRIGALETVYFGNLMSRWMGKS